MVKTAPFALTCFKRLNWYEKNNRMLSENQNYLQGGNIIWHKAYCHSNVNRKNYNILAVWKQGRFKNCSSKRLNWYCETYWQLINKSIKDPRPLKNAQFCSSSRRAMILTTGIHWVFWGLKFEPNAEIGQKGAFCKGLDPTVPGRGSVWLCLIVIMFNNMLIIWEQDIKSKNV